MLPSIGVPPWQVGCLRPSFSRSASHLVFRPRSRGLRLWRGDFSRPAAGMDLLLRADSLSWRSVLSNPAKKELQAKLWRSGLPQVSKNLRVS
jgi:hypothetical protein